MASDETHEEEQPELPISDEPVKKKKPRRRARSNRSSEKSDSPSQDDTQSIPETLPILPLRGLVVYPQTAVPLMVGQPRSVRLIDDIVAADRVIGLVTSLDPEKEEPDPEDLHSVGTVAAVHRMFRAPDGTIRLLVQGLSRIRVEEFVSHDPYLVAKVSPYPESAGEGLEVEALMRNIGEQFRQLGELVPSIPGELLATTLSIEDPLQMVYTVATYMRTDLEDAQKLLELETASEKLHMLMGLLGKELEVLELGRKIQADAQTEIDKVQREFYLREQLKAIQRELGESDEQQIEAVEFRQKITEAQMPPDVEKEAVREVDRLSKLPTAAAEYGVIRTYLDWLTTLPWSKLTEDNLDIEHARTVLNEDHYDLEDIKERILEYLAVRKLRHDRGIETEEGETSGKAAIRREREGAILCFVGPPGVGKTSLGASIARALGRKFIRMSLGGVRDEADIRGHRRTYIGAMPGRIAEALRRVESRNPVIMLDEIDKLGADFRGDPASALLEVLDPEQNHEFRDHYLDVPLDLSQVMFITTANTLDPIPGPLRDRMELIQLSGYTEREKIHIAERYLVPRQIHENGLRDDEVRFGEDALLRIIQDYTREAGVRNLEREIGAVCRKIVTQIAEEKVSQLAVTPNIVRDLLGKPKFYYITEVEQRTNIPGVATGLVWTPVGGDIVFVEATGMPGAKGFILTGQLGDVMQESARAALSYIRAHADDLKIDSDWFDQHDVHLHVPSGAVPKDGPSAGITIATALTSALTKKPVRGDLAMTGEITLRGQVLPIGGVKEKVLAAHRFGIKAVILPARNEKDLDDIPNEVKEELEFIFVENVEEVLATALEGLPDRSDANGKPRSKGKPPQKKKKEKTSA